jgi:formylglycine-generating enzyme required for sulfatase activity
MRILHCLLACLCLLHTAAAQTEKRVALVVGNARYANRALLNPAKDASAMASALREAGFKVTEQYDLEYDAFNRAVSDFGRSIKDPNTVALFYYSGHGVQYGGRSYLVPIGADTKLRDEEDIDPFCVPVDRVTSKMQLADNKINILILDACRSFAVVGGTKNLQTGLAEVSSPIPQLLVAYATTPGSVAADQLSGANGLFTGSLLKHLRTPGYDLHKVFLETRKDVYELSGKRQLPGVADYVTNDFFFFPGTPPGNPVRVDPPTPQTYTDPLMGTMVHVKGGTFTMGCKDGRDSECYEWEKPAHTVRMSDFYIGETEVTQKQWRAVMGSDPSNLGFPGCDDCPVESVSWNDIQDFLSKLNARSGSGRYRLPTEAEWEYAARGGAYSRNYAYAGSNDADRVAWYDKNSGKKTRPVKGKDPNELRLYDMSGNVWEWCADCWHGTYEGHPTDGSAWTSGDCKYRVLRGGSWCLDSRFVRVSDRYYNTPVLRNNFIGFRLARTAP